MDSIIRYNVFENSRIIINDSIINLLSLFDILIYNVYILKERFINNFYVSPEPISMFIGANIILTISYLLYFITYGSIIRCIIETIFSVLYAVITINAIQISIVYSVLDILYYFRTNRFLLREIYDSYNFKNKLKIDNFTITYNNFVLGCGFIAYVYPIILYIFNKKNINFISALLSIFPLMILSFYATSGETCFCEYNNYIKNIDKQISREESILCNILVLIVSLFFISYF